MARPEAFAWLARSSGEPLPLLPISALKHIPSEPESEGAHPKSDSVSALPAAQGGCACNAPARARSSPMLTVAVAATAPPPVTLRCSPCRLCAEIPTVQGLDGPPPLEHLGSTRRILSFEGIVVCVAIGHYVTAIVAHTHTPGGGTTHIILSSARFRPRHLRGCVTCAGESKPAARGRLLGPTREAVRGQWRRWTMAVAGGI